MTSRLLAAALMLPPLAWFLFQQGLGFAVRISCTVGGPPIGPLAGAAGLLLCAASAWIGWRGLRNPPSETAGLLGRLALGGAGAFALAIALQMGATAIEAPCYR